MFSFSDSRHIPDFPRGMSTLSSTDIVQCGHLTSDRVQHISGYSPLCTIFRKTFSLGRKTHTLCMVTTSW